MSSEINIGAITEILNTKADVDLENTDLALLEKNGSNVAWNGYNVITSNGGTVNNTIYTNTEGSPILRANPGGKGAELYTFSADNTTYKGGFVIRTVASDGTYRDLKLLSDGTCTWSGSSVMLSKGSNAMTGAQICHRTVDDSYLEYTGGTTYLNGAYFRADGKNGPLAGAFRCATADGTTNKILQGSPNGSLTWMNQHIVRLTAYSHTTTAWYRKYSDGWVEQGGIHNRSSTNVVTLSVAMANADYCINITCVSSNQRYAFAGSRTTTTFSFSAADDSSANNDGTYAWYVCGKHA